MESNQPHVSSYDQKRSPTRLSSYDNARFVVFVGTVTADRPLYGTARFVRDDMLGNILTISLDGAGPGSPTIIVSEAEFDGVITRDFRHGADYCLILSANWQADKKHQ
jgi:hypothetical protein